MVTQPYGTQSWFLSFFAERANSRQRRHRLTVRRRSLVYYHVNAGGRVLIVATSAFPGEFLLFLNLIVRPKISWLGRLVGQ